MDDRRYGSRRWKATVKAVLRRDRYQCQVVDGCMRGKLACDHIDPVYLGMPDVEFFDMRRLRAACMFHNTRRGHVAAFEREQAGVGVTPRRLRFFSGQRDVQRPLANLSPRALITGDYSRRTPDRGAG